MGTVLHGVKSQTQNSAKCGPNTVGSEFSSITNQSNLLQISKFGNHGQNLCIKFEQFNRINGKIKFPHSLLQIQLGCDLRTDLLPLFLLQLFYIDIVFQIMSLRKLTVKLNKGNRICVGRLLSSPRRLDFQL